MAVVYVRMNQVGWIHVWVREEDYHAGEPSALFFNRKNDPRWPPLLESLDGAQRAALEEGRLFALEDGGLLAGGLEVD